MVDREALLVWSFANEQLKGLGEVVVVSTEELISLCWMDVTVVWVTYFTRFVDGGILPCRECLAMQTLCCERPVECSELTAGCCWCG
jgi:hypothetical protein